MNLKDIYIKKNKDFFFELGLIFNIILIIIFYFRYLINKNFIFNGRFNIF